MAWGDLANNQMVSFTDAQGGGFTLQSGQSNVTSNQCMTKSEALAKYILDASYMDSYAPNQLVPKSTWVEGSAETAVYIQNQSTSGMVTVYDVSIDGVSLIVDSGSFPLLATQNLVGETSNTSTTASVFVSFTTPTDCAVTVYDTYGNVYCIVSPGNETFTVDLSGPGSMTIYVAEQGTACT
jgi:hypothetical protein